MKFLTILATLAATALAAGNMANMAMDAQQAQAAAAPQAEQGAAGEPNHWPPHPPHPRPQCKPGTYSCTPDKKGWRVCDWSGHWVVSSLLSLNSFLGVVQGAVEK